MNGFCEKCELNESIKEEKNVLNNAIVEKNNNLLDENIIKISQYIDKMIYDCIKCKIRLVDINNEKVSLDSIFGIHSTFYYYGEQHLFINMYNYIKKGIENNEIIYLFVEDNIYNKLLKVLNENNVCVDDIQFRNVKPLIQGNRDGGLKSLKNEIYKISLEDEVKKYNGIRWIGQPSYAIKLNSQDAFLNFEKNLDMALKDTNASLLCIYDVNDYMDGGNIINKKVIEESLETHSYILKDDYLQALA